MTKINAHYFFLFDGLSNFIITVPEYVDVPIQMNIFYSFQFIVAEFINNFINLMWKIAVMHWTSKKKPYF